MTIPDGVRRGVAAALEEGFGAAAGRFQVSRVGGGCISPAARVETAAGDVAFLKWGARGRPTGMFAAEAEGLRALAATGEVRVPEVLAVFDEAGEDAWILLEWLEPGRAIEPSFERLGRDLAAMHRSRSTTFGWKTDGFIGTLPQANGEMDSWPVFWAERRLRPQLRLARDAGRLDRSSARRFDTLLDTLETRLAAAEVDGASLLHGDLWSGNVHVMADGTPALIDPACSYGHREVDLAMAELFGGFGPAFFRSYEEAWPLEEGYDRVRRPIYQLYYLLVHVNLFGGGYVARTLATLDEALGA